MATERDIAGWALVIRTLANEVAGADLPPAEREQLKPVIDVGISIGESIVTDINRIANSLEWLADNVNQLVLRGRQ